MTRHEPTTAEIRRLLAPERHPEPSREDTAMPTVREAFDALTPSGYEHAEEACRTSGVDAGILEDAAAVLQLLDRPEPPTDRATLSMPLATLTDADGTETVLAEAVIEVQLVRHQVLAALEGSDDRPMCWAIERRITEEGRTAIEALAALLPQDGAE